MATSTLEPNFKACGLCASIVDESVEVNNEMKDFLVWFLELQKGKTAVENGWEILPTKVCITCYQSSCETKRFKESCAKAMEKLDRQTGKGIPRSWILGWSTEEVEAVKSKLNNGTAPAIAIKTDELAKKELKLNLVKELKEEIQKKDLMKRNTRKSNPSNEDIPKTATNVRDGELNQKEDQTKLQARVLIRWSDRKIADISLEKDGLLPKVLGASFGDIPTLTSNKSAANTNGRNALPKVVSSSTQMVKGRFIDIAPPFGGDTKSGANGDHKPSDQNITTPKSVTKKPLKPKRGYVIETVDESGNVVMENGIQVTNKNTKDNDIKTKPIVQSKYGRKIVPVNGYNVEEQEESPGQTDSAKVLCKSRFGRNIRDPADKREFSPHTPQTKKTPKMVSSTKNIKPLSRNRTPKMVSSTKGIKPLPWNLSSRNELSKSGSKRKREQSSKETNFRLPLRSSSSGILADVKLIKDSLTTQANGTSPPSKRTRKEKGSQKAISPHESLEHLSFETRSIKPDDPLSICNGTENGNGFINVSQDPLEIMPVRDEFDTEGTKLGEDEDLDEVFPAKGPYQCELCQNITDSKEDFVRHIKTEHSDDVDDDVMITLTTDLKKAKRKYELAAKEAT